MSTIVKHIPHTVDLNEPVKKTYIDTLLATEDNLAHCFDIALVRDGKAVDMPSGAAVTAYFIQYSDNATISLTGTASGNVIGVTLNKSCYNKAGQYAIIIKVTDGEVIHTVFYGEGTIFTSITDTILDPENVVPSLSDLLAQIAAMEAATAASKTATTNAKTATTKANTATTNANNATTNANNAAAKIDGMTVSAVKADEAGATISEVDGVKHIAFSLPKGDKGDKGEKGDPGTIENVTITSIAGLEEALAGKLGTGETAADSNKLGGKDAAYYIQPRNLLDNSDFTNPVNQRGQTSYTGDVYTIDRWKNWGTDVTTTIENGCLSIVSPDGHGIKQELDGDYTGRVLTLAVCDSDGNVKCNYATVPEKSTSTQYMFALRFSPCAVYLYVTPKGVLTVQFNVDAESTFKAKWAALYEGTYTADNLPPYTPKGYANELLACEVAEKGNIFGMELLWTNASPTSDFPAQDIENVNYGEYPIVAIVTEDNDIKFCDLGVNTSFRIGYDVIQSSGAILHYVRAVSFPGNNTVSASVCRAVSVTSAGNRTVYDNVTTTVKIIRIYGVKGVSE